MLKITILRARYSCSCYAVYVFNLHKAHTHFKSKITDCHTARKEKDVERKKVKKGAGETNHFVIQLTGNMSLSFSRWVDSAAGAIYGGRSA